ncbi:tRNA-uridine aminocarboxypropyltransferase [Thalassotalea atypica]|uniref:tRNA-uridine aminocarboxypropyltransferase n=1 Tax=Thalassotalea atypica TaxID=2054316 RepID=UPI0025730A6E|nr:tRNA-uridine aminocarboxypropyltransferase [Thalassotalea atypica]
MARNVCSHCSRPSSACICSFIAAIDNDIRVVVLQHPKEVNHTKGSLPLLEKSLSKCQVIIGESFDDNEEFLSILNAYPSSTFVLYPSEDASQIHENFGVSQPIDIKCLILLDATWKKAYKIYQLSNKLKNLPHLKLPDGFSSLYEIRKTKKSNALSTLEACCHGLSLLENQPEKYCSLLNNFVQFNQFQLSFRPSNDNDSSSK